MNNEEIGRIKTELLTENIYILVDYFLELEIAVKKEEKGQYTVEEKDSIIIELENLLSALNRRFDELSPKHYYYISEFLESLQNREIILSQKLEVLSKQLLDLRNFPEKNEEEQVIEAIQRGVNNAKDGQNDVDAYPENVIPLSKKKEAN